MLVCRALNTTARLYSTLTIYILLRFAGNILYSVSLPSPHVMLPETSTIGIVYVAIITIIVGGGTKDNYPATVRHPEPHFTLL